MDKNQVAVEVFNKMAHVYQGKFMDVSLYGDTFDFFCNAIIKENAEILELACGPGNITKYLLNKRPDFKILGTDLSANMIELAKDHNPIAQFKIMDGRDIETITKKYDAIMCGFFLPYLSKEETIKLIHDASNIINSKGLLYISTMEDDYSKSAFKKGSGGDEIFMHYHQADYLTQSLAENQFKVLKLDRKEYPAQDGSKVVDLILIAERQ
jgi:2-polyprenyl-3-methyl-5-hydroxy-6-metoxy-1,4-benzoquinol methylase